MHIEGKNERTNEKLNEEKKRETECCFPHLSFQANRHAQMLTNQINNINEKKVTVAAATDECDLHERKHIELRQKVEEKRGQSA